MLKKSIAIAIAAITLCFLLTGCTTFGRNNNLQVKVSAPAGTRFTCKYQIGQLAGSISTTTSGREADTILDIPLYDGTCEFTKTSPVLFKAAVFEGKRERFSFTSSTNTPAFRLIRTAGEWRSELIQ